ncbi:MAG: hypothetical protein ACLP1D_08005 [Xanthobacteraceae bacterium]
MDFCVLEPGAIWRNLRPMANPGATSPRRGEQRKIRYGAMAFWVVVAALMIARVLLLDVSKIRPGQGSALSSIPTAGTSTAARRETL